MRDILVILGVIFLLLLLSGHTSIGNVLDYLQASHFLKGLWHGLTLPVTFIWSLFDSSIKIYHSAYSHNGYNLGFVLGVAIIFIKLRNIIK